MKVHQKQYEKKTTKIPLSVFVLAILLGAGPTHDCVCILSETPQEKSNFSFC